MKLNPCADCHRERTSIIEEHYKGTFHIQCDKCDNWSALCYTKEEAIRNWNNNNPSVCKACGSQDISLEDNGDYSDFWVICNDCSYKSTQCSTPEKAIECWNNYIEEKTITIQEAKDLFDTVLKKVYGDSQPGVQKELLEVFDLEISNF